MRVWRALLLVFALLSALALPAHAKDGDGVRARLAKPAVLRGQFEQQKQLQGFRNPLKSSGDFLLLPNSGHMPMYDDQQMFFDGLLGWMHRVDDAR